MSYSFLGDQIYRMPTHFGGSLGPRQGVGGRKFDCLTSPKQTIIRAAFKANTAHLAQHLPSGFIPDGSGIIYYSFVCITEIEWLAGRGYNTFGVSTPAIYKGGETVAGEFLFVLWENMADPIITGREDLGFSKVYCDLPEPLFQGNDVLCRASWDGHQFASLRLTGLSSATSFDIPENLSSDGTLHYKYIPKTGCVGEADAAYPVITPDGNTNFKVDQFLVAKDAKLDFFESSWEQLPTLIHIVDALSSLDIGECVGATIMRTRGAKDLSDQRILR